MMSGYLLYPQQIIRACVKYMEYEFAMYIKNYHYANNIFCAVQDRVGGQMNNAFYATATTNNLIEINSTVSYNYVSDNI